ncbi:MAG: PQQ-binding-like beta-propeller repeat protein [Gemmataceae bacterium]
MEKDPADRFDSAAEVAALLDRAHDHWRDPRHVPLPAALREPPRPWPWVAAACAAFVLLAGVIIRLQTPDGTLIVEVDDPAVKVSVDGSEVVITGAGVQELRVRPGDHRVATSRDGKAVSDEVVTVTSGGKQVVRVKREAPLQKVVAKAAEGLAMQLAVGELKRLERDTVAAVRKVAIGNEEVVRIQMPAGQPDVVYVIGLQAGTSPLTVTDSDGGTVRYTITVTATRGAGDKIGGLPPSLSAPRGGDASNPPQQQDEMAAERFRRSDRNGDGLLDASEMPDSLKAVYQQFDANKDGMLDLNEYKAYLKAVSAQPPGEGSPAEANPLAGGRGGPPAGGMGKGGRGPIGSMTKGVSARPPAEGIKAKAPVRQWDNKRAGSTDSFLLDDGRTLAGNAIVAMALTPDGKTLVTAHYGGQVSISDFATSKNHVSLVFTHGKLSLAMAPDGKSVVVGSGADRIVTALELPSGKTLWSYKAEVPVTCVAVSPDGQTVIAGGDDGTYGSRVIYLVAADGKFRRDESVPAPPTVATFDPSENATARFQLYVAVARGSVIEFGRSGSGEASSHPQDVRAMAFAKRLSAKAFGSLGFVSLTGLDVSRRGSAGEVSMRLHAAAVTALGFDPVNALLLTGSEDGTAKLWSVDQLKRLSTGNPPPTPLLTFPCDRPVRAVAITPQVQAVTGGDDGVIRVWDTAMPSRPANPPPQPKAAPLPAPNASPPADPPAAAKPAAQWDAKHPTGGPGGVRPDGKALLSGVAALAVTPDGKAVVTAGQYDGKVRVWQLGGAGGEQVGEFAVRFPVAVATDGRVVYAVGLDRAVVAWDWKAGKQLWRHEIEPPFVPTALAINRNGRFVAVGGSVDQRGGKATGKVVRIKADEGALAYQNEHRAPVTALGFGATNDGIEVVDEDGYVATFYGSGPRASAYYGPGGDRANAYARSPAAVLHAVAYRFRVWLSPGPNAESAEIAASGTMGLAFSPDGKTLATTSPRTVPARGVELWSVEAVFRNSENGVFHGPPIATFARGLNQRSVAFTPDGKSILSAGDDGIVRVWNLASPPAPDAAATPDPLPAPKASPPPAPPAVTKPTTEGREAPRGVAGLAVTPDGKLAITSGRDGKARLWTVPGGEFQGELAGHAAGSVAIATDGRRLFTAGEDKAIVAWDLATRKQLWRHESQPFAAVAVSPDGKLVAAGGRVEVNDGTSASVVLYDSADGTFVRQLSTRVQRSVGGLAVVGLAFAANGGDIDVACEDGIVVNFDIVTGRKDQTCSTFSVPNAFARSPVGPLRALTRVASDHVILFQGVGYGDITSSARARDTVCLAFSPDGKTLLTGTRDGEVKLWPTANLTKTIPEAAPNGGPFATFTAGGRPVRAAAFTPNGKLALTAGDDGIVRVWTVDGPSAPQPPRGRPGTGRPDSAAANSFRGEVPGGEEPAPKELVRKWDAQHGDGVTGIGLVSDGKVLLTAGRDGKARAWHFPGGVPMRIFVGHKSGTVALAVFPGGQRFATAGQDGAVHLWDVDRPSPVATYRSEQPMTSVAVSPDGKLVAAGGGGADEKSKVVILDAATGKTVREIAQERAVLDLAFSPKGGVLAAACADGNARLYDPATGTALSNAPHDNAANALAFSPKGDTLVVSYGRGSRLWWWDVNELNAQRNGSLTGRNLGWSRASYLAFSPDGAMLLTGGVGGAYLWSAAGLLHAAKDDKPESRLSLGHQTAVRAAAFTADGKAVVTGGDDPFVRVWDVSAPPEPAKR